MRLTKGRTKRKWKKQVNKSLFFCLTVFFHFCFFFSEYTCIELVAGQHLRWYEWEDDCCVEIVTNSCFDILIDKQSEMAITTSHQWWQRLLMFVFFDWFFFTPRSPSYSTDESLTRQTRTRLLISDLKFIIPAYI